ncbi:hypothetical protein IMZ31_20250 (plasmid) [Pontibacillus sp. ALD_SL1]|uniref:hypothetical protein n=1 Tax=Pontibacillus sp. ALD_SL1 TaxID=2777185 RepID=UPI001A974017|nr:hypothetical protein [Pontibacillus sp. ALD_SL1]QST02882.1 hypothetical protein IMZ31_20250 [Pontibacillus sp. ALD_SL1]
MILYFLIGFTHSGKTFYREQQSCTPSVDTSSLLSGIHRGKGAPVLDGTILLSLLENVLEAFDNEEALLLEGPFLTRENRVTFTDYMKKRGHSVHYIWIDPPISLILSRMKDRDAGLKLKQEVPLFDFPTMEEGAERIHYMI